MPPPEVHLALFRGINVGKSKRIPMAELRTLFGALGFGDVATVVNSGNVVFTGSGIAPGPAGVRIREAVRGEFGVDAHVTVLPAAELERIVAEDPFGEAATDPARYLVGFLAQDPAFEDPRVTLAPLAARDWSPEALVLGRRAAYLWTPPGVADSALFKELNRTLGERITTRNWRTVQKLLALARAGG
jgi:uncharacterized protein (DUF1697 family)